MMRKTRSRARIVALFLGAVATLGASVWRYDCVQALDGVGPGQSFPYDIVQSFGVDIRGTNGSDGGAILTVELARRTQAEQAA